MAINPCLFIVSFFGFIDCCWDIYVNSVSVPFRHLTTEKSDEQTTSYTKSEVAKEPIKQPSTGSGQLLSHRKKSIGTTEIILRHNLPDSIRKKVKNLLRNQINNIKVAEKRSVKLHCNTHLIHSIRAKYPKALFVWSHNGRWLQPNSGKYVLINGDLLINNINQTIDQGVYVCQLFSRKSWKITTAIYALAVLPSATVYRVLAGSNLEVFCNSQTLGQMYNGATRTWSINGTVLENLTGIDARLDSSDRVVNIQQNQSGLWTCSVIRADNPNKYWQTNQILVEVCPAPAWWRSIMYQIPLPIVAESFGLTLFLFSLFLCAIATMKRIKQDSRAYLNT